MRIGISLLALAVCAAAAPREEYKRDFQKSVALPGGRSLRVEHSQGSINVHTQSKSEVSVAAVIRCSADTEGEAKSFCDQIQIRVEESGSGVVIRSDYPRSTSRRNLGYSVNLDIAMPDTAPLDLRNRFGNVTVQNLHAAGLVNNSNGNVVVTGGRGRQRVENSFGDVEVLSNEGDIVVNCQNGKLRATDINGAAELSNRFGDVRAVNIARGLILRGNNLKIEVERIGGVADIANSFGDVRVLDAKSDLRLQDQNGKINVSGVTGAAELANSFGEVRFTGIGKGLTVRGQNSQVMGDTVGGSAVIDTTFGNVDVRGVKGGARVTAQNSPIKLMGIGGEVLAKTTFASTTVEDAGGPITVDNQNGAVITIARPGPCKPIILRTTFSPIQVTVPGGVGYTVNAHTTFGKIKSQAELTVNGQIGEGMVEGKIAGGGCELRLTGQNSNIDILKR